MACREEIDFFCNYLKYEKEYSYNTVRAYKKDIEDFADFLDRKEIRFSEADHFSVREYLSGLKENLSRSTMNRKISCIRSFYKLMNERGKLKNDPTEKVEAGKVPEKHPEVLDKKQVLRLLNKKFGNSKIDIRDSALLEFMYSTGCRVGEVSSLNKDDVNFFSRTARVKGKGSCERDVPLGNECIKKMHRYYTVREETGWGGENAAVFISASGGRLHPRSIRRIVKKRAALAGINRDITPHTFRHSFASHMLEAGCNLRSVQEMLGHKRLHTTQVYTHISKNVLKEVYLKFHPRSR